MRRREERGERLAAKANGALLQCSLRLRRKFPLFPCIGSFSCTTCGLRGRREREMPCFSTF